MGQGNFTISLPLFAQNLHIRQQGHRFSFPEEKDVTTESNETDSFSET